MSTWPSRSDDILYDFKVIWTTQISLTKSWLNLTKDNRDICNYKFNDVMSARPEVTYNSAFYVLQKSSQFVFYQNKFDDKPTVNNGDIQIWIYWLRNNSSTGSSFFSTTTIENTMWLGQEFAEVWIDKSNNKEKISIDFALDPKVQGDLQGHMILYMTSKSHGLPRSLWPNCDSIWRKIREISAIERLMTSCLRVRKWRRKVLLRNKSHRHSAFTQTKFDINQTVNNRHVSI